MGAVGVRASGLTPETLLAEARRVSAQVAALHAKDVDAAARFPVESISAMRDVGLLGAMVPETYGGAGIGPATMARAIEIIGESCATSGMILAMHQIQVACLVEYASTGWLEEFLAGPVAAGALLASATSELGIGGDIRRSRCALTGTGATSSLMKEASVISYGEHSDAILATARRSEDAPSHDQVLVVVPVTGGTLERVSEWDSLGFRGTCSHGYVLRADVSHEQIVGDAFVTVLGRTMLPTSHIFWASLWTGMATGALKTARSYLKAQARAKSDGDTPMGAARLAHAVATLQQLRRHVRFEASDYERRGSDPASKDRLDYQTRINSLKVVASETLVRLVQDALLVCGMAGYRNDSRYSLGRVLRDSLGAVVQINNERLLGATAQALLITGGGLDDD